MRRNASLDEMANQEEHHSPFRLALVPNTVYRDVKLRVVALRFTRRPFLLLLLRKANGVFSRFRQWNDLLDIQKHVAIKIVWLQPDAADVEGMFVQPENGRRDL